MKDLDHRITILEERLRGKSYEIVGGLFDIDKGAAQRRAKEDHRPTAARSGSQDCTVCPVTVLHIPG